MVLVGETAAGAVALGVVEHHAGHLVVVDDAVFLRVGQLRVAHALELLIDGAGVDVQHEQAVGPGHHDVAGAQAGAVRVAHQYLLGQGVLAGIFRRGRQGLFFGQFALGRQAVLLLAGLHQAAVFHDLQQVVRYLRYPELLIAEHHAQPLEVHGDGVAVLYMLIELVVLQQEHAVVVGIAEEYAREAGGDHAADAGGLHRLRRHLARGAAAEVGPATMMSPGCICSARPG